MWKHKTMCVYKSTLKKKEKKIFIFYLAEQHHTNARLCYNKKERNGKHLQSCFAGDGGYIFHHNGKNLYIFTLIFFIE